MSNRSIAILTTFLVFLAIMVTFNTVRLNIFSSSEQISIMRLVGASNGFIRGPFVVEGIIYGIIASTISFLLLIPVIQFASQQIGRFVQGLDLTGYLGANWLMLLGYQFLFGLGISVLSSWIAIRRYLRN